jgi:PAS domain S-box-containing protein
VDKDAKKLNIISDPRLSEDEGIESTRKHEDSEDYFRQISETIPAVLCIFSANSDEVFYVSPSYERIFGRSCEDLYKNPKSWLNSIHPEDCQNILNTDKTLLGKEYEVIYRIIRPDGAVRWMKDRIVPIQDKSKKVDRILRFIEDITENKQIEEALRDSFQRSVDIVNAIPSGLFIYQYEPEDSFILIDGNPAAERMTNMSVNEYRGHDIRNVWLQAENIGLIDKCLNVIENGKTIEDDFDYRDRRFEGSFRVRIFRMPGNQLGIALENLTELKKSVEMVAQAFALGRIEMFDSLIHNIGNAINSVTTGIGTLLEILTKNRLTRHVSSLANAVKVHQDDFVDYIRDNPQGQKVVPFILFLSDDLMKQEEELTRIVNRVRDRAQHIADIVRTEKGISGKGIYRKQVNLPKAIDDAINVLQDSIKKRNIEISIDCEFAPKDILIQESQFHQMLINLIKNSVEAIDELDMSEDSQDAITGSIIDRQLIQVRCYAKDDSLIIDVIDKGIGIEESKLEAVFRPGWTTKESGSGLGLHSVANFIKTCNGQITAISDGLYKGTTMRISLPLSSII